MTKHQKLGKHQIALNLPTIASYNVRALFPKVNSLKKDILERSIDLAFISEIWEVKEKKEHALEVEKMLEFDSLKYLSKPRPPSNRGGGVAIITNMKKYTIEKLNIVVPDNLEVIWGLLKPKKGPSKFKNIIVCSFYSPPNSRKNNKLVNHLIGTLHLLTTEYPDSGIIMGADKNSMNILPLLNCGLKLRQMVDKPTINGKILDVLISNLSSYYNSPIIAPPIGPDDPLTGKPSDHAVPVCWPHTDRHNPPKRAWRVRKYRPLPESKIKTFGQWITQQEWGQISSDLSATEQASLLENILVTNLNRICPEKSVKIGTQDKPWMNFELKKLHRIKSREYTKRGKTRRYWELSKQFEKKYKEEASKYMKKNVQDLMELNPGRAYGTLKRMGMRPDECQNTGTFTLPAHAAANLSSQDCAERIANHFSEISKTLPALSVSRLPRRVQTKLRTDKRTAPSVTVHQTWQKIERANKPRAGVPGDLPKQLNKEFSVELSVPLCNIINQIISTAEWPTSWKREYVTPVGKIPEPVTEDDLRPVSLTNFFSKVTEHFIVTWLLEYVGDQIDFRQYGGQRGNSISHYLIEFINFILSNQENTEPTAILACMIDFSKAFNRINHNILITKLSDMGVPAWLLRIVMAFLKDRTMVVRLNGATSSPKNLPGGGPQGTLLGLLLFLVMINDVGFENQKNNVGEMITSRRIMREANQIHLKFVDDLTVAESIILRDSVRPAPNLRPQPDSYHTRTGHVLKPEKSSVLSKIKGISEYAETNDMKLNLKKTKFMLFNTCSSIDFHPTLEIENCDIELAEEMRLLGVIITSDLKFHRNTDYIVKRGFSRIWILKRLKNLGATQEQLIDIYTKQIRSILELAAPVWQSSLTQVNRSHIERVQRAALQVILGNKYTSYSSACQKANLPTLEERRVKLCKKFAQKAVRNTKHQKWFRVNIKPKNTRMSQPHFCPVIARTSRFDKSPISYLTNLLNVMKTR